MESDVYIIHDYSPELKDLMIFEHSASSLTAEQLYAQPAQPAQQCCQGKLLGHVSVVNGLQGVKGVACIWRAHDDFVDRFNLPLELPADLVCHQDSLLPLLPWKSA